MNHHMGAFLGTILGGFDRIKQNLLGIKTSKLLVFNEFYESLRNWLEVLLFSDAKAGKNLA